ncbi:MAG: hypothetical protein HY927_11455 [Elusimicrobia bacterium]|nr:hypothetical protein [Elusimicrobiota bacterium]
MSRTALLLPALVLGLAAQALAYDLPRDTPAGAVAKVFLRQFSETQRTAAGQKEDFDRWAAMMDEGQRRGAAAGLARLEAATRDDPTLADIAAGYLALGGPEDAVRAAARLRDGRAKAARLAKAALLLQQQGRFDPGNESAQAVLLLSQRRVEKREIRSLPARKGSSVDGAGAAGKGGAEPWLSTAGGHKSRQGLLPPVEVYHMPDTKPPSTWAQLKMGVGSLWQVYRHKPSPKETTALAGLKAGLDSFPSGSQMIREMGGWERIEKEVYFMYADMPDDGTLAYVRPLAPWEARKTGKRYVLAINNKYRDEQPEAVLPVVAHELWHVADKMAGHDEPLLSVTSEHGAHLRQVYLFQEVDKKLTAEQRKELEKSRVWLYQKWVVSMWEDHLKQRYARKEDYQKVFAGSKNLEYLAGLAYEDVLKKAVGDGTPQVLYHVSDLYANATNQPEVTEDALLEKIRLETDQAKRRDLENLLKELRAMRASLFQTDQAYRVRTAQTLP